VPSATLTGRFLAPDGTPMKGTVTFAAPSPLTLPDAGTISVSAAVVTLDDTGSFEVDLIPNSVPGMSPFDWPYKVTEKFKGVPQRQYHILLADSTEPVDLAQLAPVTPYYHSHYLPVTGPAGPQGPPGPQGVQGEPGPAGEPTTVNGQSGPTVVLTAADVGADAAGSALAAQTQAVATAGEYTDGQITAEVARADGAYVPLGDPALTDARTPTSHSVTHAAGGSDQVTPAQIGAYSTAEGGALADRTVALETGFSTFNDFFTDLFTRVSGLEGRMTSEEDRPNLLTVDGAPDNSIGRSGDYALDTGARRLYGPKAGATWMAFTRVPPPTELGWSVAGFAALAGEDLYLTHAADGFGAGSSWYGTVQPTDGLDVTFEVEMSGGTGADGVCFALADPATATSFVGAGGGDLGLVGCTSVALALDTGAGSRARIVTTTAAEMTTVATYGGALTLRPAPVTVRVRYAAGAMSAWVDGLLVFDEVAVTAGSTARIGWTGANGGLTDDHIIRNAEFVSRGGIDL
jgi:hypothetical protein